MAVKIPDARANAAARRQHIDRTDEVRAALGGDLIASAFLPQPEDNSDFEVELSIGWVDINTVFPMGAGIIGPSDAQYRTQPRTNFSKEEMARLRAEIKVNGQLTPAWVREIPYPSANGEKRYNLIDGERRWRVMKELEEPRFLIRVLTPDTRQAFRLSMIADIHNVAHTSVERGRALIHLKADMEEELEDFLRKADYQDKTMNKEAFLQMTEALKNAPIWLSALLERYAKNGRTPKVVYEDLEPQVGLTERSIRDYIKQTKLEPEYIEAINSGAISGQHGSALASLDDSAKRKKLFKEIKKNELSADDAKIRARELKMTELNAPTVQKEAPAIVELRALLGRLQRANATNATDADKEIATEILDECGLEFVKLRRKWA